MKVKNLGFALWFIASSCLAELKTPAVFSDGMVFQRDHEVAVWGWADPGHEVSVYFVGAEKKAKAGADGRFMVRLNKMKASADPQTLVIKSGDDSVEIKNVLIGEVWLCSGQSNMLWPVEKSMNFDQEKASAHYPEIRMFLTDLKANIKPQDDCTGSWKMCTPQTVGDFSAVAYFFGREIHSELGVPVGLIRSAWGGTRIEAWSPMSSLEQFPGVMRSKELQDKRAETYTEEKAATKYAVDLKKWEMRSEKARAAGQKLPRKPRKPVHPHSNQNYPANLYNAMIHPLVPYSMRGAIWYQGEANAHSAEQAILYRDLLENLVNEWREVWDEKFPFYAVQLVNYRNPQVKPVEDTGWAFIRESFLRFHKEVPNVGIAVGIDVGDANDIHPKDKQTIGYRLAQQALKKTYGHQVVADGPLYASYRIDGNKMVISFDGIGSGLVEQDGKPLRRFAIAGADQQFVEAQAVIVGETVFVSSEKVATPVAVRYAWADNPVGCNLFNAAGFPASPFRTDRWPSSAE